MQKIFNLIVQLFPIGAGEAPTTRIARGLRTGDQRELLTGAALLGYRLYRTRAAGRELIFRKEISEGSAVVIRSGREGELRDIEITPIDDIT